MEPYRVFISSIMNRSVEDLFAEREAARSAVEHYAPITTPWVFEAEPASPKPPPDFYINGVKNSDLFVLIIGQRLTKPVRNEYDTARDHGKPMLVFAKTVVSREPDAEQMLRSANVKYDAFINAAELREKARSALENHILTLVRGDGEESARPGDRPAQRRAYAQKCTPLKILPMVPAWEHNSFRVKAVESGVITFEKYSNRQDLAVPAQRIEDLLSGGPGESPTVLLNGRLQWITMPPVWRFFPDKPPPNDTTGLGFGKERPRNDPGVSAQVRSCCGWSLPANIAARLREGCEVFYDEDGKYLSSAGQVLLFKR